LAKELLVQLQLALFLSWILGQECVWQAQATGHNAGEANEPSELEMLRVKNNPNNQRVQPLRNTKPRSQEPRASRADANESEINYLCAQDNTKPGSQRSPLVWWRFK